MSKRHKILNRIKADDERIAKLSLIDDKISDEFLAFKTKQNEEHQRVKNSLDKDIFFSSALAFAGTVGAAALMVTSTATMPILLSGLGVAYMAGAVGIGAAISKMMENKKYDKTFGSADLFLKERTAEHLNGFVDKLDQGTSLTNKLKEVNFDLENALEIQNKLSEKMDLTLNEVEKDKPQSTRNRRLNMR